MELGKLSKILKNNDIVLAIGLVIIVVMMVIPIPAPFLDLLLTVNISLAVALASEVSIPRLIAAMSSAKPVFASHSKLSFVPIFSRIALSVAAN